MISLPVQIVSTGLLTMTITGATGITSPLDVIDQCVVVQTAAGGLGTAFWVVGGRLVTAAHVVGEEQVVWLRSGEPESRRQRAIVVSVNRELDVAVLQPEQAPSDVGLQLIADPFPVGSRAYAIGSPIGELVLSQGSVVAKTNGLIETSTPVDPGSSGGPLVDREGRVRGLVVSMSRIDGHAFSVPAQTVQSVIARAATLPVPALPSSPTATGQSAIQMLTPMALWIPALCVLLALGFALIWFAVHSRPRRIIITVADLQEGPSRGP